MNIANQNFITGLIGIVAVIASLILTLFSIYKVRLEIRNLSKKKAGKKAPMKNNSTSSSRDTSFKFPVNAETIVDILFFLLFSIGSINAIVEFLANTTPVFALVVNLFFVPLYSFTLFAREKGYYRLAGVVGLFISSALLITWGFERLMPVFSSPNNSTITMLFSLVENLTLVPLLVFSLVSSQRIIRSIANVAANQESA